MITPDAALRDPALLGAALGDPAPWATWSTVLRASYGLTLTEKEQATFHQVAGERSPPNKRVRELWTVCSRRSGKSRIAAALSVYEACFVKHNVAPGEVPYVLVLAASRDQAKIVFNYMLGFLQESPVLKKEIANVTQNEITLRNGTVLGTHANSFRSIRGRSIVCCVFDECALWRDEASAIPDLEVYRATLPSLMTCNGILIGISSPYRKIGLLYTKHRDHFGVDGDDVLVVQGPSTAFNPTLSQAQIDAAIADDPESGRSEWGGEWRTDLSAFLDDQTIDAAINYDRPLELPPASGFQGKAFCDPSGGRHDAFTICIGHRSRTKQGSFEADVIRARRPPFDPKDVVREYSQLCKDYRIGKVIGDRYSAEWVVSAFRECGIVYEASEKSKSDLYLESLPLWTRGVISMPNLAPLIRELRLLERQTHRGGKDAVDHPKRGSDDLANSLCACAAITLGQPSGRDFIMGLMGENWREEAKKFDAMQKNWMRRLYGNQFPV